PATICTRGFFWMPGTTTFLGSSPNPNPGSGCMAFNSVSAMNSAAPIRAVLFPVYSLSPGFRVVDNMIGGPFSSQAAMYCSPEIAGGIIANPLSQQLEY